MKSNTDAKPPRRAGTSTETQRGRWPLTRAMSGAWGALGGRRSTPPEPVEPSPEALAQLARAREILQHDRALSAAHVASVRTTREQLPSPTLLEIATWIAEEAAEPEEVAHPVTLDAVSAVHPRLRDPADPRRPSDDDGETFDMAALASLADVLEPDELALLPAEESAPGEGTLEAPPLLASSADALADEVEGPEVAAASSATDAFDPEPTDAAGEPIRTRTMARLLASQGYLERALMIYDHLLAQTPDDDTLRVEAARAREQKTA